MSQVELKLRPRRSAPLPPAAWFLPGSEPEVWLDEIARWPVDHDALELVVVREGGGHEACGMAAIANRTDLQPSGCWLALGKLGDNVYLPVDAELSPEPAAEELAGLLSGDYLYVWLPGRGLTAAEPSDRLGVADLLSPPGARDGDWDRAVAGVALNSRLVSVLPLSPPSVEDFINEAGDGIGTQAAKLPELPKAPGDKLAGAAGAAKRAALWAAAMPVLGLGQAVRALGGMIGGAAGRSGSGRGAENKGSAAWGSGRSWRDGLSEMAESMFKKIARSLESQRSREVGRLLDLLDNDPDKGLEYALPVGGSGGEYRGLAPPGGSLTPRSVNFSLGGLGGGGPADVWDLDADRQQQLIIKYRELAARETRLGRHRRAAYIYAQLLGDLRSAASTLEQGRHFREAAALYRDKLNDRAAAAECFERGELYSEAIDAYRELQRYEKAGDLLALIEQPEAAAEEYHAAAEQALANQDRVRAARLQLEKLHDKRLALETLDAGWPGDRQAKECVKAAFVLRGQLGWHDESRERVVQLVESAAAAGRHADVASLLAEASTTYPEAGVQGEAAKRCRDLVAHRVGSATTPEAEQLLASLTRLAPGDRLLGRDTRRFLDQRHDTGAARKAAIRKPPKGELRLVKQFDLGEPGIWRAATISRDRLFVAGVSEGRVVIASADLQGNTAGLLSPWPDAAVRSDAKLLLPTGSSGSLNVLAVGEEPLRQTQYSTLAGLDRPLLVGAPRGLGTVWGAAVGKTGHTWGIASRDDPVLVCVDSSGGVVSTQSLLAGPEEWWHDVEIPVPMHVASDRVVLGVGCLLLGARGRRIELLDETPGRIVSLAGGPPYAASLCVAALEQGVAVVRLGIDSRMQTFAPDLLRPAVMLNPGGLLVAADQGAVVAYDATGFKSLGAGKHCGAEASHSTGTPVALLPAAQTNRFVMVADSGRVSVYEANV